MAGHDIERYLNVRNAWGAGFDYEGERAGIVLDTTGTTQVWSMDGPGKWPRQLTFYDERVSFADWSPTRDELAFGKDTGGNGRVQFYRLSGDGGSVEPLTQTPNAKHRWGGWSHGGDRFAFTSNRRDRSSFDVYVQRRDEHGEDATLVHETDGWFAVAGWSIDDEKLALRKARGNFDHDLFVLDLTTGETTNLTPGDDDVRYHDVEWGPNREALYLRTDAGSDTFYFARLDIDSGRLATVEDGGEWNVDSVSLDEETGRFVITRNVDGYSDLVVGELTGETTYRTFPTPDLPRGLRGGALFAPGADRFMITVTGRTENANVYVVDVATGDAERWTHASTAGVPREAFVEPRLVHYETFDGREIPAFYSVPENPTPGETPVVVDVHGGPESQRRPTFNGVNQYLLGQGYALFEPNVRGSSGYGRAYAALDDGRKRMDAVRDLRCGVEWLHDQPAVDPNRIAAMGTSYGGFMVLAGLTEYPDLWAAGVDIVGIANLVTFLENTGEWRRELREAEYGSLEEDREFLEKISPIHRIERIDAPLYVAHGANDPRVPVSEAEQLVERTRDQSVSVELNVFEDEGHGFSKLKNRVEVYGDIASFLDEHV